MMPILRKFTITMLTAASVIAAPSAALASTVSAGSAVAKIHQVACRSWTFNVHYGTGHEICFEGTGGLTFKPPIQSVHEITTGENTGYFWANVAGAILRVPFHPHQILNERNTELIALRITGT